MARRIRDATLETRSARLKLAVRGKPYYLYDDDRNGRLDRSDADRHTIAPVYWTIYEWD